MINEAGYEIARPSVLWLILLIGLCLVLPGCVPAPQPLTERNAALTQGNIQMHLVVGQTTKAEVLETFGAPNITTRDGSGREVWTSSGRPGVAVVEPLRLLDDHPRRPEFVGFRLRERLADDHAHHQV